MNEVERNSFREKNVFQYPAQTHRKRKKKLTPKSANTHTHTNGTIMKGERKKNKKASYEVLLLQCDFLFILE